MVVRTGWRRRWSSAEGAEGCAGAVGVSGARGARCSALGTPVELRRTSAELERAGSAVARHRLAGEDEQ